MFSMAVAGLAKSLIAVTITLNPAAAHHGPSSYTIRPGETLSQIAARAYGSAATTLNLLRAYAGGGLASLDRVHAWNTAFARTTETGVRYEQLAG